MRSSAQPLRLRAQGPPPNARCISASRALEGATLSMNTTRYPPLGISKCNSSLRPGPAWYSVEFLPQRAHAHAYDRVIRAVERRALAEDVERDFRFFRRVVAKCALDQISEQTTTGIGLAELFRREQRVERAPDELRSSRGCVGGSGVGFRHAPTIAAQRPRVEADTETLGDAQAVKSRY